MTLLPVNDVIKVKIYDGFIIDSYLYPLSFVEVYGLIDDTSRDFAL